MLKYHVIHKWLPFYDKQINAFNVERYVNILVEYSTCSLNENSSLGNGSISTGISIEDKTLITISMNEGEGNGDESDKYLEFC